GRRDHALQRGELIEHLLAAGQHLQQRLGPLLLHVLVLELGQLGQPAVAVHLAVQGVDHRVDLRHSTFPARNSVPYAGDLWGTLLRAVAPAGTPSSTGRRCSPTAPRCWSTSATAPSTPWASRRRRRGRTPRASSAAATWPARWRCAPHRPCPGRSRS